MFECPKARNVFPRKCAKAGRAEYATPRTMQFIVESAGKFCHNFGRRTLVTVPPLDMSVDVILPLSRYISGSLAYPIRSASTVARSGAADAVRNYYGPVATFRARRGRA